MTIDFDTIIEIDPDNDEHKLLLKAIQGNILKSHGRNHAVYLFLKFKDGKVNQVKQWIRNFAENYVTSALEQAEQRELFRKQDAGYGTLFANFFLTRAGYMYLGVPYEDLPHDDEFLKGMKDFNAALGDPPVEQWEKGFQGDIHTFVFIAGDKAVGGRTELLKLMEQQNPSKLRELPSLLKAKVQKFQDELKDIAEIVHYDEGFVLRDITPEGIGEPIEHFGFRDGVSQPLFLKQDIEATREKSSGSFSEWDPRAPLNLVLFKDPLGKNEYSYGSFLAYRKLEQNVPGWNKNMQELANTLGIDLDLARAYAVGRFQDGTAVVLSDKPNSPDQKKLNNNFNFAKDLQGYKCPFHSHIRKTNPRGDTQQPPIRVPLEEEKAHRIVRRALSYGETEREKATETGSGLLFLCCQANITNQFRFMQEAWANRSDFVRQNVGADPVIGQGGSNPERYSWPSTWGSSEVKYADFGRWITMKGGEYFFAPSMSYLQSLGEVSIKENDVIKECEYIIHEIKEYQRLNWAIGTNPGSDGKDRFVEFFKEKGLHFEPYALTPIAVGSPDAYRNNINKLISKIYQIDPNYKLYLD
ncbi:MAG: Dyp-type peroxidase [Brasilonema sp.]